MDAEYYRAVAIAMRQMAEILENAAYQCRIAAELNEQARQECYSAKIIPIFEFIEKRKGENQ